MPKLFQTILFAFIVSLSVPLIGRAEGMPIEIKLKDSSMQKTKLRVDVGDNGLYQILKNENYKKKKGKPEPSFLECKLLAEHFFSEDWKVEMAELIINNSDTIWNYGGQINGLKKEELSSHKKYKMPFLEGMSNASENRELEPVAFYHCGNDRYCIMYHGKRKEQGKESECIVDEYWQIKFHAPCRDSSAEKNESQKLECSIVSNDTKPISVKLKSTPMGEKVLKELTGFKKEELPNEYSR